MCLPSYTILLSFCTRSKRGNVWLKTCVYLHQSVVVLHQSVLCASLLSFCTRSKRGNVWLAGEECVVFLPPVLQMRLTGGSRRLLKYQCCIALILPNCICAGSKYTQKQNTIECHCVELLTLRPRKSESPLLKRSGKAALEAFTRKRPHA